MTSTRDARRRTRDEMEKAKAAMAKLFAEISDQADREPLGVGCFAERIVLAKPRKARAKRRAPRC